MRISTLAQRAGASPRLLRYYEEQGLLRPLRLANGYRDYDESHVTTVRHIRVLLDAGLPTAIIARLLQCVHEDGEQLVPAACPGVITQLRRERNRIVTTITRLQSSKEVLDTMLAATRSGGESLDESFADEDSRAGSRLALMNRQSG